MCVHMCVFVWLCVCLYVVKLNACVQLIYNEHVTFNVFLLLPADVAKWVLDKQITRTQPNEIIYNYELIDDFNTNVGTWPVGCLYHYLKSQNQVDAMNCNVNSQYNKLEGDSNDSGKMDSERSNKYKPQENEAYNHMLYLMVSRQSGCAT